MKISVRNLEPTKVKLTVTVDPEEFNPYLDNARKEIAKQVNVPGFRKGHVPARSSTSASASVPLLAKP